MTARHLYSASAFAFAHACAHLASRPAARRIADRFSEPWHRFATRRRAWLTENLATATGFDGVRLDDATRETFRNFGRMLADYFHFNARPPEALLGALRDWRGIAHLKTALDAGRGALLVTGHLGAWELGGQILAAQGYPVTVVTLPEPGSALTRWRAERRRQLGIETVVVGTDSFAFLSILAALRANRCVAMLVDRPYRNGGDPVQLFGRDAEFSSAPARIAASSGTPVLPAFVVETPDARYMPIIEPPVELAPDAPRAANTARIAAAFEPLIREQATQWYQFAPLWNTAPLPASSHA
jgi:KDO2-lipid IV(A) lauroyltransferase